MNLTKILLKAWNDEKSQHEWLHACYVSSELYEKYTKLHEETGIDWKSKFVQWYKEDFGKDIEIDTLQDIQDLRAAICEYSKKAYPEIFLKSSTDRQGWMRIWVNKKIREELETYESKK